MKKDSTRKRPAPLVFRLMDRFSFVLCAWNSQMAETVMALVAAVVLSPKLGQIKLAFEMPVDASPEAKIKRVQRYFGEALFDSRKFANRWIGFLMGRYVKSRNMRIAFDWTKEGGGSVLTALLVLGGRGLPLMMEAVGYGGDAKGMAAKEDAMACRLRKLIPEETHLVWLMDRGFGNERMVSRVIGLPNSDFVIRLRGNLCVTTDFQRGRASRLAPRARKIHFYENATICKTRPFTCNLVITPCGAKNGKRSLEQWILATSMSSAVTARNLYAARWAVDTNHPQCPH